jgi:hypothetical protein
MRDGNLLFDIPDWPVFTRYMSPIESKARARIRAIEKPIAVSGSTLSHLRVASGDWVFGRHGRRGRHRRRAGRGGASKRLKR